MSLQQRRHRHAKGQGHSSTIELAYSIQRSIRRSHWWSWDGLVRKLTRAPSSPRRPSSGVNRVVVSADGGLRKAAGQTREGIALSAAS